MKYLLTLLFLAPLMAYAAPLNIYQGGTGANGFPVAGYLYGNDQNKILATSSPTVGWITATSTTGTSIFQNLTVLGTCTGCGTGAGQNQSPWLSNIDAKGYSLLGGADINVTRILLGTGSATSTLVLSSNTLLTSVALTLGGNLAVSGGTINFGTGSATSTLTTASGNLGIASTVPGSILSVGGFGDVKGNWNIAATSTAGSFIATSTLSVGTSTPGANNRFVVDGMSLLAGHVETQGPPPVVSSCGTSPTIAGNDQAGKVTIGTAPGTSCTLTFANPWKNAPACFSDDETTSVLSRAVSTVTTLTLNAIFSGGDIVSYGCFGFK